MFYNVMYSDIMESYDHDCLTVLCMKVSTSVPLMSGILSFHPLHMIIGFTGSC